MVGATKIFVDGAIYRPCRIGSTDCSVQIWISSKCCARSSALSAVLKNCTPRSNSVGTVRVGVVKYLAIFQNGLACGCSVPEGGPFRI